ncbi:hypothetical protein A2Y85_05310 [candidate division WOR-3 bacterium RBG_13_43_14]|uniref:DNA ligase n=1 Tax=candidate division WOR-3 bacterium RBG_13_43_14 TaxID=1802590 RepID=A0A1F4U1I0_UNCW3|nr:MAG: hypothetical protein A2Y85_05310 [candidate division WOR-3 bacterium RBG_13_43_14]
MQFKKLLEYSKRLKSEASRNAKIEIITQFLNGLGSKEADSGVHFIAGHLPQGKINIGWKYLSELLKLPSKSGKSLVLNDIHISMDKVSKASGKKKIEILKPIFELLNNEERKYLISLIFSEAQQGAGELIVKTAIARYFDINDDEIEQLYLHNPDLGSLFAQLKVQGKSAIEQISIQLFKPVKPMLAQVSESIEEVIRELDQAAVEYKLDGVRIQVHRNEDEVRIFSRNLKDMTIHFPDLVSLIKEIPAKRFILDGEAIALDEHHKIVPFQILARRTTRKRDIERTMEDIPVFPQYFDIIFIDDQDLTSLSYEDRYRALNDLIKDKAHLAARTLPVNPAVARQFFDQSIQSGNEGIVIKSLDSSYRPGKRGKHWFKIKRVNTIDCVILAAEWGYGRRTGWLSNLHLGIYDETKTKFLMVGKTFKGLTDNMLKWLTENLPRIAVHKDRWTVYVKPQVVVEIAYNDVLKSPRYDSGVALRFARVKRIREDKNSTEINTILDIVNA